MAKKKGSAKRRQAALKRARKDGRVTGAEAKNLRRLGVSKNRITGGGVKITKRAKNLAAGQKPSSSAPKPTPTPTSANTRSTQTQARVKPSPSPTRSPSPTPSSTPGGGNKDTGNRFLTGRQANQLTKILNNPERFPATVTETPDEDGNITTTTTPGDINYAALSNQRLVGKAQRGLKASGNPLNNINSENDLQKLLNYAKPLASNTGGNNQLSQFGARASGKISDIREALGVDRQAALDIRDSFARKGIETTDPQYERLLGRIEKGINEGKGNFAIPQLNRTFTGVGTDELDVVNSNRYARELEKENTRNLNALENIEPVEIDIDQLLKSLGVNVNDSNVNEDFAGMKEDAVEERNDISEEYMAAIKDMDLQISELGKINNDFRQTNNYLTSELNSANAAVEEAQRREKNLRTAFVPAANPTALSIMAGDFRQQRRKRENNELSSLTTLSDLGTSSNQLPGLQLA